MNDSVVSGHRRERASMTYCRGSSSHQGATPDPRASRFESTVPNGRDTGEQTCRPLHAGERTIKADVVLDRQERYGVYGIQVVHGALPASVLSGSVSTLMFDCLLDWTSSLGEAILVIISSKTTTFCGLAMAVGVVEEGATIFLRPGGRCIGGR